MARIRSIKPDFPHSESMGRVSRDARLLFIMLWTLADDSGTLRGNSRMLASLLFPYDDDAPNGIEEWLEELERQGCIACYEYENSSYVSICNWQFHQKIDKPTPSKLPQWDGHSRTFATPLESSASSREESSLDRKGRERKGGEGKGKDIISSEPPSAPAEPPVMEFPVVGDKAKPNWPLTQSKLDEYAATYPAVDALAECRKARQWCIDNPSRRKTAGGMASFLNKWMQRVQNDAGQPPRKLAFAKDYS